MGQFSWLCAACDEAILSEGEDWECFKCEEDFKGKEKVLLLTPDHDPIIETDYEGYGVFGGVDAYSWLARINGASDLPLLSKDDDDRGQGIDLHFWAKKKEVFPIKIIHARCNPSASLDSYERHSASDDDPDQGWQERPNEEGSLTICGECL